MGMSTIAELRPKAQLAIIKAQLQTCDDLVNTETSSSATNRKIEWRCKLCAQSRQCSGACLATQALSLGIQQIDVGFEAELGRNVHTEAQEFEEIGLEYKGDLLKLQDHIKERPIRTQL